MLLRILRTAAWGVVGLAAVVAFATLLVPRLVSWTPYVVTSGSMEPTFGPGALVLASPVEPAEIQGGDIVTFRAEGGLTTHRIVKAARAIDADGNNTQVLTTKGDANEEADPTPLDGRNVVGQARVAIPGLGYAVAFMKTPLGAGLVVTIFLGLALSGGSQSRRDDSVVAVDGRKELASS